MYLCSIPVANRVMLLQCVLYGIFAPELVVATAASQHATARWLKREIEKDGAHWRSQINSSADATQKIRSPPETWSISQCFYASMGGFVAGVPWMKNGQDEALLRVTITPAGIRLLSFLGRLPKIQECQIQDKSKADWMAKTIVSLQAGWMLAQVLGRIAKGLPVSLLEINTCGHVACAICLYALWWSKPVDIRDPTILEDEEADVLTLMLLCSRISAVNDNVPDIRCFYFDFSGQKVSQVGAMSEAATPRTPSGNLVSTKQPSLIIRTELSLGSTGNQNIQEFIGYLGRAVKVPTEDGRFVVEHELDLKIAPECLQQYHQEPYTELAIRHGDAYCRRARLPLRRVEGHRPLPAHSLARASGAVRCGWAECEKRPAYKPVYFTIVPKLGDAGFFLSETEYLADHNPNFPTLSNLSLGQVNIHRHLLPSIFAFTALAYGVLHLSAWNDFFPSDAERALWIAAALIIACSGALIWAFFSICLLRDKLAGVSHSQSCYIGEEAQYDRNTWVAWAVRCLVVSAGLAFALARVFLVIEAFVSLRRVPPEMYLTPDWSGFVPHL